MDSIHIFDTTCSWKFGLILLHSDFKLGNLLWNKLKIKQEYPIIFFQPDVKSLRELVYYYAATVIQLQTYIITSLVI